MTKRSTHAKHHAHKLVKSIVLLSATILAAFVAPSASAAEPVEQVVFVCERGNVKSLMAASYFNQLAAERKLPLRAISRGVSPNSTSVPPAIVAGLQAEGIEVSTYRPVALSLNDASQSRYVVTIGTDLPDSAQPAVTTRERWDDVPAASTNYSAARDSLRAHVRDLIQRLSNQASPAQAQQASADTSEPAAIEAVEAGTIEEVTVSGEQPGPGLWKISKDGHVMWVLGTLQPLPKKMVWRSQSVEAAIAESQELLTAPKVDAGIGFFKGMTLLPSMIGARNNPDDATLHEVLPSDVYARWLALKERYIGRDEGIEKWRPIFAAGELYEKAISQSSLTTQSDVVPVVKKIAKRHKVKLIEATLEIEIDEPRQAIKQFKKSSLQDIACFTTTLDRLETDLDAMRARATACGWNRRSRRWHAMKSHSRFYPCRSCCVRTATSQNCRHAATTSQLRERGR